MSKDRIPDEFMSQIGGVGHLRMAWGKVSGKIVVMFTVVVAVGVGVVAGRFTAPTTKTVEVNKALPGQTVVTVTEPAGGAGAAGSGATTVPGDPAGTGASSTGPGAVGTVPTPTNPAPTAGTVSLINVDLDNGGFTSNDKSPVVNGKPQLLAITAGMGCYSTSGIASYNLGRNYTQLTSLLGIDDNSANAGLHPTIEVDGDGLKLATYTPTLGHPVQMNVNVSGVLRLDLQWSDAAAGCDSQYGVLVLGDPELTTVPGYKPSPSAATSS